MTDKKIIKEWLNKASEDYKFACANLSDPLNSFFAQICFHFQQSAEKYLKAYIVAKELKFKKIHQLTDLLSMCAADNPLFKNLQEECELLTDYYMETRYPVHWSVEITKQDTEKAKESAEKIGTYVKDLLKDSLV